jgi:glucuronoarabinoxylan endo-1,4-beta-xylanase
MKYAPFILCLILLSWAMPAAAQTIAIDTEKSFQIIRGFGGIHINAWTGQQINEDLREKAFDNDPGEIGLSIFRMWVDPNKNGWSAELPVAQYAVSKGALVFASPWNPPSYMTERLRETEHGTDYVLLPEYYDNYTDHLNDFVSYMNQNGVPLYAISVQNEPDWHGWTVWSPQQMLTFIKEYTQDIHCRIIAPETFQYRRQMTDPLLNDSIANSHIDILGTHLYGTLKEDLYYPLAYEKNKEIWMTEHLFGNRSPEDNTWELAMVLAEEINTCLDAQMSAFVYWYIRRFYGLINDAGNITDKGYVMAHFSKFIRPGAYRVEAEIEAAPNVSATACKTDSGVVVVVVNNNHTPVDLTFTLHTRMEGIDSLTKFTTSETKKIVNDGTCIRNEESFTASVDAFSITTFTSDASNGGKYGNLPPVASGGGDREVLDSQGMGVSIVLKGSESTDADGVITNYSWAKDGYQISTSPDIDLHLNLGNHTFLLTVTDNDGATDSDTINISIYNLNSEEVWLEAECTEMGGHWQLLTDVNCSNGEYITVTPGVQAINSPSANMNDRLVYPFHVKESGYYTVWGRVLAPTPNDDSFWVRIDEEAWVNWNSIPGGNTWQWDDVHNQANSNPMAYALDTGYHALTVCFREDGAAIDKFYITNTGKSPSGKGEDATNCDTNTSNILAGNETIVKVYPNPVKTTLTVESSNPFQALVIYDAYGRKILEKKYPRMRRVEIPVSLTKGMYILCILFDDQSFVTKFMTDPE